MKIVHVYNGSVREVWTLDRKLAKGETVNKAVNMPPSMDIWAAPDNVEEGWLFDGVNFQAPPAHVPTADDIAAEARALLAQTDRVPIRCLEGGLSYPPEWRSYRATLRQIAGSGVVPGTGWPSQPPFPSA